MPAKSHRCAREYAIIKIWDMTNLYITLLTFMGLYNTEVSFYFCRFFKILLYPFHLVPVLSLSFSASASSNKITTLFIVSS